MRPTFYRIIRVDRMVPTQEGTWVLEQLDEQNTNIVLFGCTAPSNVFCKCGSLVKAEFSDEYSRFGRFLYVVRYESITDALSTHPESIEGM